MNIFLRELKANLKSLLIWCGVMLLLILVAVAKYSAFVNDPSMLAILNSFPKQLVQALEMNTFNLTTLSGFFGIMFVYFGLMGAIAAAMWGSDSISREERDKTVEFSLVLPVSRSRVVTAKALAGVVDCFIFALVTWGLSVVSVKAYAPDPALPGFLRLEMAAMLLIELVFLAIGLLLGCVMKNYKSSGSVAVSVILVTYFFSILAGMESNLDFLKYFSPFKYFDAWQFFNAGHLDGGYIVLTAAIIAACLVVAYVVYNKRDLYI